MARKKITANLNGGDAITDMADLQFQVHDASDDSIIGEANYAAIGSVNTNGTDGANITYTLNSTYDPGSGLLGQIVLDGVDLGAVVPDEIKIRCKDESGNESVLSAAETLNKGLYFHYVIDEMAKGELNTDPTGTNFEFEFRALVPDENLALRQSISLAKALKATTASDDVSWRIDGPNDRFRLMIGDGVSSNANVYIDFPDFVNYHIYKVTLNTLTGAWETFVDGVSDQSGTLGTGGIGVDLSYLYLGNSGNAGDLSTAIKIDWVRVGTETFEINEGSGTTVTGDEGTVLNITGSPTWIVI